MTLRTWTTPNGDIKAIPAKEYVDLTAPAVQLIWLEEALDDGRVYVETRKSTAWQVRRNGKTKRWKRDPLRFEIPAKAGLRDTFTIFPDLEYLWVKTD